MIFLAIGNFYYVGIYHSVDLYLYIVLYSIAIVNYDYRRKIKNRKKKHANTPSTWARKHVNTQSTRFSKLCQKLVQINGIVSKLRHYVPQKTCISVYFSLFYSFILYGKLARVFIILVRRGVIANHISKMRKIMNFKVHELSFTTKLIFMSCSYQSVQVKYQS